MLRALHKLNAKKVEHLKESGLYGDGGGLYLQITSAGVKSWLFRYMRKGKARGMGLGPLHTISLAEARVKAHECRRLLLEGIDPLDAKQQQPTSGRLAEVKALTFQECATRYINSHKAGWKNAKHADQWINTLATYAHPVIGDLPVATVDLPLVMKVLQPIWTTRTETASRLRGRIESVLDWAAVSGFRSGDNPARWKGHLDKLLPKRSKVQKVEHHPALPYAEMVQFMQNLATQEGISRFALEFLILTAARTNEVIKATWDEVDFPAKTWTIPAERMKAGREHCVPLSEQAMRLVQQLRQVTPGDYIFPGMRVNTPLSNMAMLQLLKRMKRTDLTAHGFRSTFRDWAGECTNHPREVCEAALAHQLKDKAEAAYARGDLFAKRAKLMADWAEYCYQPAPKRPEQAV
jgi:integrase